MLDPSIQRTKILLLDDHALFRESVARLLKSEPGFEVTAHCNSIEDALVALQKAHVDIVAARLRPWSSRWWRVYAFGAAAGIYWQGPRCHRRRGKRTDCRINSQRHFRNFHEARLGVAPHRRNPGGARGKGLV